MCQAELDMEDNELDMEMEYGKLTLPCLDVLYRVCTWIVLEEIPGEMG